MPNGGSDCCGECPHNRAVQEMGYFPEDHERFWDLCYCTLHEVNISNPFWTYCPNFESGMNPRSRNQHERLRGWIMANGLFEGGYVRIPWDDKNEPDISVPAVCAICGRNTGKGIKIDHDGHTLGFCTNRHYVEWWKTIHDDDSVNPEDYELPEGRHK